MIAGDQGRVILQNITGSIQDAREQCYMECVQQVGGSGCELVAGENGIHECFAYTVDVAYGPEEGNSSCWNFKGCDLPSGITVYQYITSHFVGQTYNMV